MPEIWTSRRRERRHLETITQRSAMLRCTSQRTVFPHNMEMSMLLSIFPIPTKALCTERFVFCFFFYRGQHCKTLSLSLICLCRWSAPCVKTSGVHLPSSKCDITSPTYGLPFWPPLSAMSVHSAHRFAINPVTISVTSLSLKHLRIDTNHIL